MSDDKTIDEAYETMLREHVKLRGLLDELKQMLTSHSATMSEISNRLVRLQSLVEEHFRTEEDGGCLDDLVSHAPHFADRVGNLIAEHGELTVDLNELVTLAAENEGLHGQWDEVSRRFHLFVEKLMQHENVENELLQAVFTEDIGSKD